MNPKSISPLHAIKLSTEEFIVADIKGIQHHLVKLNEFRRSHRRIRRPNQNGHKTFEQASVLDCYFKNGDFLVVEQNNERFLLMSSALELKTEMYFPKNTMKKPFRMCLDELNGRLYVAEEKRSRLKIFNVLPEIRFIC